jgi:activator of HSP90 ATPase
LRNSIKISQIFPVSAKRLYDAWLSSREHSDFTHSKAEIKPKIGTNFTAGNGYISGHNVALQPYSRIVQSWRTTDFPENTIDSKLEILFEKVNGGTRLTLIHTQIPNGQITEYEKGWKKHYFKPMKAYFKKS